MIKMINYFSVWLLLCNLNGSLSQLPQSAFSLYPTLYPKHVHLPCSQWTTLTSDLVNAIPSNFNRPVSDYSQRRQVYTLLLFYWIGQCTIPVYIDSDSDLYNWTSSLGAHLFHSLNCNADFCKSLFSMCFCDTMCSSSSYKSQIMREIRSPCSPLFIWCIALMIGKQSIGQILINENRVTWQWLTKKLHEHQLFCNRVPTHQKRLVTSKCIYNIPYIYKTPQSQLVLK